MTMKTIIILLLILLAFGVAGRFDFEDEVAYCKAMHGDACDVSR